MTKNNSINTWVLTDGSIPIINWWAFVQDNVNLFYDIINHRLGIGTTIPISPISTGYNPNFIIDITQAGTPTATPSETGGSIGAGTYYYVITAQNILWSTAKSVETVGATITGTTGSIALSWTAVPWAIGYTIYRTTTSGTYTTPAFIISNRTTTSYTDTASAPSSGSPSADNQWAYPQKQFISYSSDDGALNFPTVSYIEKILANTSNSTSVNTVQQLVCKVPIGYTYQVWTQVGQRINMLNYGSGVNSSQTAQQISNQYYGTWATWPSMVWVNAINIFSWIWTGTVLSMTWAFWQSSNSWAGTVTNMYWIRGAAANSSSATTTNMYGAYFTASDSSAQSNNSLYGIASTTTRSSTGNTSNTYWGYLLNTNTGTGTIWAQIGLYLSLTNTSASGNITSRFGLYLAGANSGTITNNYWVYQEDSTAKNWFAWKVGIGALPDSTSSLDVNWNIKGTTNINTQTWTTYTLAVADRSSIIEMNNGSANVITIPLNASVVIPIGTIITVTQYWAWITTVTWSSWVTVNWVDGWSKATLAQYQWLALYKRWTDEWIVLNK